MVRRRFENALVIGAGNGSALRVAAAHADQVEQIELSQARARATGARQVETLDVLDLAAGSFDAILSVLELHWSNDPVGELIQMRRALRPDGLLVAALFGGQALNELRAVLAEAEIAETGGLSPRVAPTAEIRDLGALLQRAGYAMPVADVEPLSVTYAGLVPLLQDLRRMGETSILRDRPRTFLRRGVLARADAMYREAFPADGGRIRATFDVTYLTGWAPGPDQPQPKRPGSANTRLADALKTVEKPLPRD